METAAAGGIFKGSEGERPSGEKVCLNTKTLRKDWDEV